MGVQHKPLGPVSLAENALREAAGDGGFADATWSGEQVGMRGPPSQFGFEAGDQLAIAREVVQRHRVPAIASIRGTMASVTSAIGAPSIDDGDALRIGASDPRKPSRPRR